jgi:hypothetical protein
MKFQLILGALLLHSFVATAQSTSDTNTFLANKGFPETAFTLKAEWLETVGNRLITGYSLQPANSNARIDLYRDADRLLTDAERTALGIQPKNWAPTTASAPSHRPTDTKATPSPQARPHGLALTTKIETLALPPYTPDKAFHFDPTDGAQEKPANQIGDLRPFTASISVAGKSTTLGRWHELPSGGALWRAAVLSPGATGQRLHLSTFSLPSGAQLTVYNPTNPAEAFAQTGIGNDLWLPTVFHEEVVLEVFVPTAADLAQVALTLDQTAHIYAPLTTFQKVAGPCNLDVTCYPDWADTALGVCGIGTVTASGALFCTATLVADNDDCATTPYVLTANHCVGGQGGSRGANNLEFYWFFQSPTCGGVAPSPALVPRTTGGADYLAGAGGTGTTGGGNDFTFVRMRNAPPIGTTYVGWDATDPPLATETTCIHHPRGEYKRIAFGTLTNTDNTHSQYYHEVTWHDGTTEPGSSGSPMFLTDSQQIIGQLWGGGASCAELLEPDYYGRFSLTYPVIESYLDPTACAFTSTTLNTSEALPEAEITVQLTRPAASGGLTLTYAATPGTALPGIDFTPVNGTVTVPSGANTATFDIPLLQDLHADDGVTILLALSAPSCGEVSPTLGTATLVILDDDPDTDNDGLSDYDETNATYGYATNPNLADSDDDGLNDYDEVLQTYGYNTDPNNPDTDADDIPDYFEILIGNDPTIADLIGLNSLAIPWFH